jgi:hypothetical protein
MRHHPPLVVEGKDRAVAKLHELAPDIALYEKEKKRAGGVIFGGLKISEDRDSNVGRKRSTSKDNESGVDDEEGREAKRLKNLENHLDAAHVIELPEVGWTTAEEDEEKASNTNGSWRESH